MIYTFTNITSQLDTILVTWVFSTSIMMLFIEGMRCPWARGFVGKVCSWDLAKVCLWDLAFVGNYDNFPWCNMCHDLDLLRADLVCL